MDDTIPMGEGDETMASRAGCGWWRDAPKLSRRCFQMDWVKLLHYTRQIKIKEEVLVAWIPYLLDQELIVTYLQTYEREQFTTLHRAKEILDGLVGSRDECTFDVMFNRKLQPGETLENFVLTLKNMASLLHVPDGAVKTCFLNGLPESVARKLRKSDDISVSVDVMKSRATKLLQCTSLDTSLAVVDEKESMIEVIKKLSEDVASLKFMSKSKVICFKCQKEGPMAKNCPQRVFNGSCFKCGRKGHRQLYCTKN